MRFLFLTIRARVEYSPRPLSFSHLAPDLRSQLPPRRRVPGRCVPRNVAVASKWVVDTKGNVSRTSKKRFTTDDSWDSGGLVQSRNGGIDQSEWPRVRLPSARDLARATAILRYAAARAKVRTRLYARDLTAAYRQWGACRSNLGRQCFIWVDGVAQDWRLEFGTASAVQIFERLAALLIAYAIFRCAQFDRTYPPEAVELRRWLQQRAELGDGFASLFFLMIYIDVRAHFFSVAAPPPHSSHALCSRARAN